MSSGSIQILTLEDDELFTPDVGDWAEDKYKLVKLYGSLFTTSMRQKWDDLVYLDLFAGAGRSRIRGKERIVPASPTLALTLDHPFDRYVFCERNQQCMEALRARVERDFPDVDARFLEGDVNGTVPELLAELPRPGPRRRVLGFCFADPFSLGNLRFETLAALCDRYYMDFLVLVPSGYDATRNEGIYLSPTNQTIDHFLGNPGWRDEWAEAKQQGHSFDRFMTDAFGRSMVSLGYIYGGIDTTQLVKSTDRKLRLYRLALFSRHPLGARFWREVKKYAVAQRGLFD